LSSAKYELKIDGVRVGEFTKEQLAEGVNLAVLPTPMLKQAKEVNQRTLRHNDIHFTRWRNIQVPMASYKSPAVVSATENLMAVLDKEEAITVQQQRAAAQPVEHKYELIGQ
jgi:hypothetical protein